MLKFRIVDNKQRPIRIAFYNSIPGLLVYGVLDYMSRHNSARLSARLLGSLLIAAALFARFADGFRIVAVDEYWLWAVGIGLLLILLSLFSHQDFLFILENDVTGSAVSERENAEREYNKATTENTDRAAAYFELDTKRANEYYLINQQQAKSSFNYAIWAMVAGFAIIIFGIWLLLSNPGHPNNNNNTAGTLSTLAGVVINLISLLFIRVHNQSQKRSLAYFDQLMKRQELSLAIHLAESMKDDALIKSEKQKIISSIVSKMGEKPGRR